MMTMQLIERNGKKVLKMEYTYANFGRVEYATVYGLNKEPYIKRMGQKFFLTPAMLAGEIATF